MAVASLILCVCSCQMNRRWFVCETEESSRVSTDSWIELEDVRVNNLQGYSVRIRHGSLTVICGISGFRKSSLASILCMPKASGGTLRRFRHTHDCFSTESNVRLPHQLMNSSCDRRRQNARKTNLRGTVGSRTELADDLQILFATLGQRQCPMVPCSNQYRTP